MWMRTRCPTSRSDTCSGLRNKKGGGASAPSPFLFVIRYALWVIGYALCVYPRPPTNQPPRVVWRVALAAFAIAIEGRGVWHSTYIGEVPREAKEVLWIAPPLIAPHLVAVNR